MNYGAGKSKFYAASDQSSHESVNKLLPPNPNKDPTLYLSRYEVFVTNTVNISFTFDILLSRSTFYNNKTPSMDKNVEPEIWNSNDSRVSF